MIVSVQPERNRSTLKDWIVLNEFASHHKKIWKALPTVPYLETTSI
jgi:hypothetical protein